jgi:hypothetical protein
MAAGILQKVRRFIPALALVCATASSQAATIVIVNNDAAGEGFNDPTAAAPVGCNNGTTIGQQRLNVFQEAAAVWGRILPSAVQIRVNATFDPLTCTSSTAVLGTCGAAALSRNFPNTEFADTWYPMALANKISGTDLDPAGADMNARFNSNLGNSGCLEGSFWYYGLDHKPGSNIDLLVVMLHEMGHGLGFATQVNGTTGTLFNNYPDVFSRFILDDATGLHWYEENDAQRAASAIVPFKLLWDGAATRLMAPLTLQHGRAVLRVNAPAAIAGDLPIGTASFGPALSSPGVTGAVVLADDGTAPASDACTALINGAEVAGKIAIVDRGDCNFTVKVKACQDAGAMGVIVVDNVTSFPPVGLGGTDPAITIPSVSVTQADGGTLKAQIASGLNVTLATDPALLAGADAQGRVMLFTPNPFQSGSSVSHWDASCMPNLLMEPSVSRALTSGVDLTRYAFEDLGWQPHATSDLVLLVSALSSDGIVRIIWQVSGGLEATVERSIGGNLWQPAAQLTADDCGRMAYEDPDVEPGHRYGYRLVLSRDGSEVREGDVWVDVPPNTPFALRGAVPNPAVAGLKVEFTLPVAGPVRLELYDVGGRRVLERTRDLEAGGQVMDLGDEDLATGIYLVRLTHGGRSLTSRVCVMR